ncbi:unnamed protein product [Didymodactylos carnosus]|uniref:RNA transcription, translation and transport factor protein n=1 Tax=Didymodactylos carnosus TaxID=1234261 RepID=A0A813UC36_9BILA|nr:unnamed protein product [Didymodactylos carnosus]CAF1156213.1 unnamed protein product [Didymodactylos carnosus]CAF3607073.1 unnamed protein product [Didymodactylos carnosus]CAF3967550.1 unnamed protein product [Didymodactylos carnosus]
MYRRKLAALDYLKDYNPQDENDFRNMIVWLEDMKIRLYPIEDRQNLRNVQSPQWNIAYQKYLEDLKCPHNNINDHAIISDWLIGSAVRLEYGDSVEKFRPVVSGNEVTMNGDSNKPKQGNPLDNIDFTTPEFKQGMERLCDILQIPRKFNDTTAVLRTISKIITTKLSKESMEKQQIKEHGSGVDFSVDKIALGFTTGDAIIDEAAKILRLLYIQDLRLLQTKINEAIVAVQSIVADPKTDSKLGKTGY